MGFPVVAVVGRPNVGKSTIFNRIAGDRISIVEDTPGVTRDRIYTRAEWLTREFRLIDTGGIDMADEPFMTQIVQQAEIAIDEADVIIFMVSAQEGLTEADERVAKILYRSKKPVVLAVNKVDNIEMRSEIYEFYALGFGDRSTLIFTPFTMNERCKIPAFMSNDNSKSSNDVLAKSIKSPSMRISAFTKFKALIALPKYSGYPFFHQPTRVLSGNQTPPM